MFKLLCVCERSISVFGQENVGGSAKCPEATNETKLGCKNSKNIKNIILKIRGFLQDLTHLFILQLTGQVLKLTEES